jgi:hypothetical protein
MRTSGFLRTKKSSARLPSEEYLAQLFLEREMFLTKVGEKIKTHTLYWIIFFSKIVQIMRTSGFLRTKKSSARLPSEGK